MIRYFENLIRRIVKDQVDQKLQELTNYLESRDFTTKIAQNLLTTPTIWGGDWSKVELGKQVNLVNTLLNVSSGKIVIGDFSFFGHNVSLLTGTHFLEKEKAERQAFPESGRDIFIGDSVWIASNAVILGPCRIGDRAVIAAGAIVTHDTIESDSVYAGCPAKRIR